jgi:hypothetical protein
MSRLAALLVLVVPSPTQDGLLVQTLNLASLTRRQAYALEGRLVRYRVVIASAPGQEGAFTLWDCEGLDDTEWTVWVPSGPEAEVGAVLLVEGRLQVLHHARADGFEAFTEYRLVGVVVRGRAGWHR